METDLTSWGWYQYGLYLVVVSYAHFYHDVRENPVVSSDSDSAWHLWKIVTVLFENCLNAHFLITLFYWTAVYPTFDCCTTYVSIFKHSAPIAFLFTDSYINAIAIEKRHWVFAFTYQAAYSIFYVIYTKTTGLWIYEIAKLDTPESYAFSTFVLFSTIGIHFLLCWILNSEFFASAGPSISKEKNH